MSMKTIYNNTISNIVTSEYLDYLTDKVFALLPMYEESVISTEKEQSFKIYQTILIQTINGNACLVQYNNTIIIDILSHLEAIKIINTHAEYKRHILKVCKLLTTLKKGVLKDGL